LWIADCGLWIVDCGLWIVDCGLWIVDCGLWIVDCGLWIVDCGLWKWEPPFFWMGLADEFRYFFVAEEAHFRTRYALASY